MMGSTPLLPKLLNLAILAAQLCVRFRTDQGKAASPVQCTADPERWRLQLHRRQQEKLHDSLNAAVELGTVLIRRSIFPFHSCASGTVVVK
jgi:hypothetical protein